MILTLIQPDIIWENPSANMEAYTRMFNSIENQVDVILLPELFSTGFTMQTRDLAEPMEGTTMKWMSAQASHLRCDLAGSLIIMENGNYYNRLIWMRQDGSYGYYDKRHLFRMSGENEYYSHGSKPLIVEVKGFRIKPLVCYDLRFPVWSRNRQDYDILIYHANWPAPRRDVWLALLKARAIENQTYLIGVNRVGKDGMGIEYHGDTMALDAKGQIIASIEPGRPGLQTINLSLEKLTAFRKKFPVWKDADLFTLPD
jgi:omega-amidase